MSSKDKNFIHLLREFSIPLIAGVVAALALANVSPETYRYLFSTEHGQAWELPGHLSIFGHHVTLSFLINDIFMVFFFGIAAKEIVEACLPGGSLNPVKKAINPLLATVGGVLGPVAVFFGATLVFHRMGAFPEEMSFSGASNGWGIPTATDIALAWVVARAVFGPGHPAINFLLLLAVADDAIGLGIIAVFYGDAANPAQPAWLGLVVAGMAVAYGMRKAKVNSWVPYVAVAGPLAWSGLVLAHLHPALALIFIVPFLPAPERDTGLFVAHEHHGSDSPLHAFEHQLKGFVDFGLFFFAFGNAGVQFSEIGPMTWIVLGSLIVGKVIGITLFSYAGVKLGIPLPDRMTVRDLCMTGFIASLGLTVALFVAGAAYPLSQSLMAQAKMGALFSGGVGIAAILLGRVFGMQSGTASQSVSTGQGESKQHETEQHSQAPTHGPPPALPSSATSDATAPMATEMGHDEH